MGPPSKTPGSTLLSTCWCLTLNNYTPEEVEQVKRLSEDERVIGIVVGEEVGEEGTPHLQGYVRFAKNCRMSTLKKYLDRAHFEKRLGPEKNAWDYCKKDGKILVEKGEPRLTAVYGSRDAEAAAVIDKIESGMKYPEIRREHKVFCFWHRQNVFKCMSDYRIESVGNDPFEAEYSSDGTPLGKFS